MSRQINDEFIDLFVKFEQYIRVIYSDPVKESDHSKYETIEPTVNDIIKYVYAKKLNPIIAIPNNKSILDSARQLRNLVDHEGQVAVVSEQFLASFRKVVDNIVSGKTVSHKMIPISNIKTAHPDSTIGEVLEMMSESGISNIPVFKDGILLGVFSESSLYRAFVQRRELIIDFSTRIKDVYHVIDLDGMQSIYYDFIGRDIPLITCYGRFMNGYNHKTQKRLELLFVTHSGKKNESILGLITLWDLKELMDVY
jgi:CBS domain-containing protein